MARHVLTVKIENGSPTCSPSPLFVDGGDEVIWTGLPVVYRPSPFEEGEGPFGPESKPSKIKKGLTITKFTAFVREGGQEKPCKGQIIIRDP